MSKINHCFHSTYIAKYGRVKQYQMFVLSQYFFPHRVYFIDTKSIPVRPLHFIRCISCHIIERVLWRAPKMNSKRYPLSGRCVSIDCKLISVGADWRLSQARLAPHPQAKFITGCRWRPPHITRERLPLRIQPSAHLAPLRLSCSVRACTSRRSHALHPRDGHVVRRWMHANTSQ